MNEQILCI